MALRPCSDGKANGVADEKAERLGGASRAGRRRLRVARAGNLRDRALDTRWCVLTHLPARPVISDELFRGGHRVVTEVVMPSAGNAHEALGCLDQAICSPSVIGTWRPSRRAHHYVR